jgi:hypothetical protein
MDIDAGPAERIPTTPGATEVESYLQEQLFGPVIIQSAAVLEAVKTRPGNVGVRFNSGATAGLDSFGARRRPESTVGAEESPAARSNKRKHRSKERGLDNVA